ncbi:MFS transporter [Kordiimonas lacus]|uniref:Na+/melibiose symporter n=1 Tax=Kordiimonas lacus TaxID=637679 RepID=A0A1G7A9S7_9PROT|nr:MFS transporter [Kordiimonas lacus]SDE10775.1 Na+/melibiose symporter [Kordiimonas lacus]
MSATMSSAKSDARQADDTGASFRHAFQLFFYGLPGLALAFPLIPFAVYLPTFYAEDKALGFTAVAVALFLSRLIDMVSDPFVGKLSDSTKSDALRRKGWMAVGGVIASAALIRLCLPGEAVTPLYLGAWSAVLYIGWTMVMIPYQAWGADIARNEAETTRFTTSREAWSLVGMLCALALPLFTDAAILPLVPQLLIPIGAGTLVLAMLSLPNGDIARTRRKAASLLAIVRTPQMRGFGTVWFFTATASAIPAALFPLYVSEVLKGTDAQKDLAILIYFAAAVLAMPVWAHAAKGANKKRIMALGMAVVCLAFPFATLLGAGQIAFFYVICVVTGCALAAELTLGPAVLADIAKARHHLGHAEMASHFAIWGMISKLAFAFAILLAFGALGASEAVTGGAVPPLVIALVYALLPALLKLMATRRLWQISAAFD